MGRPLARAASFTAAAVCMLGVIAGGAGCGSADPEQGTSAAGGTQPDVLTTKEAKFLLLQLPYRYAFRPVPLPEGASGAIAGRVTGPHRTSFYFGVSLGRNAVGVPVPEAGTSNSIWSERLGFAFTTNLLVKGPNGNWIISPEIKTQAQSAQSDRMEYRMLDALCKGATGKVCPV
jgi:hypothetical protein